MKRIGSFSSAIGFIYLGMWMIIKINDPVLAKEVIKWWPLIIITLGVEILVHILKGSSNERFKLSGFFIPIIIVFAILNYSNSFFITSNDGTEINLTNIFNPDWLNFNENNKSIESTRTLEAFGNSLTFTTNNGNINIQKSKDKNIYIKSNIYVKKSSNLDKYDIPFTKTSDGYSVVINDKFVRSVKAAIYIPEGYNVDIKANNMEIKSDDEIAKSRVDISMNNGKINLKGDIENSNIKLNNGTVSIENNLCKNVNIDLNNGTASVNTEDENISVDMDINLGTCKFNNIKKTNSRLKDSIGTGEGKVTIKLSNGTAKVYSNKNKY